MVSYEGQAELNLDGEYQPLEFERDRERERAARTFVNADLGREADAELAQSVVEQTVGIATEVEAFANAIVEADDPPVGNDHAIGVMRAMLAVEGVVADRPGGSGYD